MRVLVPTSVDVKAMVAGLNVSPTRAENLKIRMYYFLSKVVTHNDNWRLNEKGDFYRNICSELMKDILGNKEYYLILKLLKEPKDPIIESNESYSNLESKGCCKGYRLTEKYNTGEVVFKQLPTKFANKVKRHNPDSPDQIEISHRYQFLISQYDRHPLGMDSRVYTYIQNFGKDLLRRVENNNLYQTQMVYNLIGRWLYYVEKIELGELNPQASGSNHRVNSRFTGLPKVLRGFVTCKGRPLVSLDLKASQPYILSKVMNNEFFTSTHSGFNLKTIYPFIYQEVMEGDCNHNTYEIDSDSYNHYHKNSTSYPTKSNHQYPSNTYTNSNTTLNSYPFMWCKFFFPNEIIDIEEYQLIPFEEDYYSYILKKGEVSSELIGRERNLFKKSMMYILYDEDKNHRWFNPYVRLMKKVFPGVNKWIEEAQSVLGKRNFALLLQRAESYLLLHTVARKFHNENTCAPIFSIHDGLYTYEEFIPSLSELLLTGCNDLIGIRPGVKVEYPNTDTNPSYEDLDSEWKRIRGITTLKRFKKKRRAVFSSNIERGESFMNGNYNLPAAALVISKKAVA